MMLGPTLSRTETDRRIPARRRCIDGALLIVLVTACLGWLPATAATFTVMNLDDAGVDSLRAAITAADGAAGADTIVFNAGLNGTITLVTTLPDITDADGLTIDGDNHITISGDNLVRPFIVIAGANLSLENLTISDGSAANGGGIHNSGSLTLTNSTLSDNSASFGPGGGIVNNTGSLTLINSTLSGNSTVDLGGGILNNNGTVTVTNSTLSGNSADLGSGAGIYNLEGGILTVTNSTLSDNSADLMGGGIHNTGTLTLTNSTLSGNSAGDGNGGGILNNNGTVTLANSLIANSPDGGDCVSNNILNDGGHNLVGDGSCIAVASNGNLDGDPVLGPLAGNDGPTQTHALLTGSPAIDAGDDAVCAAAPVNNLDQRGLARPQGNACDIGAFEAQPAPAFSNVEKVPVLSPWGILALAGLIILAALRRLSRVTS